VRRHRRAITAALVLAATAGFVYFVVPKISGLSATLRRLRDADPWWIGLGVGFEALSLGGYVVLFRTVFSCEGVRIGWRESYQINMAGTVASKLLATAGAGGVALTVWALRAAGLEPRVIARRLLTFALLLYAVFAAALLIVGAGLRAGALAGRAPWTLTVLPATVAGGAILIALSLRALPPNLERRIAARDGSSGWTRRLLSRLASAPSALRDATGIAAGLVRERRVGILGAVAYWGFDLATLWAALHAFGAPPPVATIVMSYFVGQLANVLPLPGGIGGVEGGTIGALIAFGAHPSLAVLGVLAYRAISFWLPTVPGSVAYLRLRRTVSHWREA
jgi:uncharacterized membrane protein YbhN (UPF0104 family)